MRLGDGCSVTQSGGTEGLAERAAIERMLKEAQSRNMQAPSPLPEQKAVHSIIVRLNGSVIAVNETVSYLMERLNVILTPEPTTGEGKCNDPEPVISPLAGELKRLNSVLDGVVRKINHTLDRLEI